MKLTEEIPPLPEREPDSHKGTFGRDLLIAGSKTMRGAAILAARSAYRAGAGLVTVGADRRLFASVSPAVPEAIFLDTGRGWSKRLTEEALDGYQAVLIGPGLGTTRHRELAKWVLAHRKGPLVIDADALNIIASEPKQLYFRRDDWVWTPHPGEFLRLTGEMPEGDDERIAAARRFVGERGGVLVLKGHRTVVMDSERYAINSTGNPGMATAGTGDVLAGMLTAFLGQGLAPFHAARLAVHLHGLAGDLAAGELGEASLVAGDLIDHLPPAIVHHQERLTCRKD